MSLATRCSACGTVFRVVQDQLRVSGGWVRCGRCAEVFNAIESLVDLDANRPHDEPRPGERLVRDHADPSSPAPPEITTAMGGPEPAELVPAGAPASAPAMAPVAPAVAVEAPQEPLDARPVAAPVDDEAEPAPPDPPSAGFDLRGQVRAEPLARTPAFLRQAEREARWRRTPVRLALGSVALFALLALAVQAVLLWHDWAAARWPAARPLVAQLCAWQGCRLEPPRDIESLAVESSGLVRAGPAGRYRLAVVLRNREAAIALRAPSVDLTLTDALGQVLARRVLDPAQLGVRGEGVEAGAEMTLTATLRTGDMPIVGYTIELFYP